MRALDRPGWWLVGLGTVNALYASLGPGDTWNAAAASATLCLAGYRAAVRGVTPREPEPAPALVLLPEPWRLDDLDDADLAWLAGASTAGGLLPVPEALTWTLDARRRASLPARVLLDGKEVTVPAHVTGDEDRVRAYVAGRERPRHWEPCAGGQHAEVEEVWSGSQPFPVRRFCTACGASVPLDV